MVLTPIPSLGKQGGGRKEGAEGLSPVSGRGTRESQAETPGESLQITNCTVLGLASESSAIDRVVLTLSSGAEFS